MTEREQPTYDEWGINKEYNNPRGKGIKNEDIEKANEYARYWYNKVGVITIPCVSWIRGFHLMEYADYYKEDKDMSQELFDHLIDTGVYYYGIAALCGLIKHGENKGKYFNLIDFDNPKGRDILCTDSNGVVHTIDELSQRSIVDTNKGSPGRGHMFIITERPLTTKFPDNFQGENKPKLEIYGGDHAAYVANSYKTEKLGGGAIFRYRSCEDRYRTKTRYAFRKVTPIS